MEYRALGGTGLRVSALSLGASALGGVFGPVDEPDAALMIHEAIDRGINLIDVAPYYGLTRAESVLGRVLRGVPRERYFLATKVGRYGVADFDFSAARVTASVDESLTRLGVEYLDLIQAHDIEFGDINGVVEETLPALEKVRERGKARLVGVTGLPLKIYPAVLDRCHVDVVLSYCHYTLNDTALLGLLAYLESKGVGIISAAPLGMGLLNGHAVPDWHPAPRPLKDAVARAAALCRSRGADLAELALRFALANPRIHSVCTGTAKREELRRNLACVGKPPVPELLDEVLRILAPVHNLSWPSGRPENN